MKCYSIGQLAQKTGFSVQTIRYYETMGLIECDHRASSGYRYFSAQTVVRLQFIRHLKDMCFTIKEIQEVLYAADNKDAGLSMLEGTFRQKIAEIEEQIIQLNDAKEQVKRRYEVVVQNGARKISEAINNPDLLKN